MVLLGDEARLEDCFSPFGDSTNLNAREVYGLRRTYHRLRNCFGSTRWNSYVTWLKWKLVLVHLDIVLSATQDRCTVCAECTIGSKIVLVHLDMVLVLMQDRCTVCAKRTIGSKIFLDPPNGTPG